jgi:phosphoribosylamine-glycine ligase
MVDAKPLAEVMRNREKYRDWHFVWDGNHNTEEGEKLRDDGFKVFGGSQFTYDLENDREYGTEFAESCGLIAPDTHEFKDYREGVKFLEANEDKAYVVKPNAEEDSALTQPFFRTQEPENANIEARKYLEALKVKDFILQERVKGVEVNVEMFVSHGKPVFAQANLEDKYSSNGDLGCPTGCAFDLCWEIPMDCPLVKMTVGKFAERLKEIDYTGFADANVIVNEDGANFIEFCMRAGYNAHPNLFLTIGRNTFLQTMADLVDGVDRVEAKKGFGASVTLFTQRPIKGLPIFVPKHADPYFHLFDGYRTDGMGDGEYAMGGYDTAIGVMCAHEWTPERALDLAVERGLSVKFPNLDMRTDCAKDCYPLSIPRRYQALEAMGLL